MPSILAQCQECCSLIPDGPDLKLQSPAQMTIIELADYKVANPCPHCGGQLKVEDGKYLLTPYAVKKASTATRNPDDYLYGNYLPKLAQDFEHALDNIEANHGFEYGAEFEQAIITVLRRSLPNMFGVCRGYVVNQYGDCEGDDIIIYDRLRYPRMRLSEEEDDARKQRIPIEAVYAYIEAKHTLTLSGSDGQSLAKSLRQIQLVRAICSAREAAPLTALTPHVTLPSAKIAQEPYQPPIRNQMFTAIIARRARLSRSGPFLDDENVLAAIKDNDKRLPNCFGQDNPDFVAVGRHLAMLPMIPDQGKPDHFDYYSPFRVEGAVLRAIQLDGMAFGVAIASLLFALDNIQLARLRWSDVVGDAICRATGDDPGITAHQID